MVVVRALQHRYLELAVEAGSPTDIKSNNPRLTGGKKEALHCKVSILLIIAQTSFCLLNSLLLYQGIGSAGLFNREIS